MPDFCDPCKSRGRLAVGSHLFYEDGKNIRKCDYCRANRRRVLKPGELDPVGRDHPEAQTPSAQTPASIVGVTSGPAIEFDGLARSPEPKPQPAAQPQKEKAMPTGQYDRSAALARVKAIDWSNVQDERNSGVDVVTLAKKYDVSKATIVRLTTRPLETQKPLRMGKMAAAAERAERPTGKRPPSLIPELEDRRPKGTGFVSLQHVPAIAAALRSLREQRARIDESIRVLESL